jgi:hypothetical protein
MLFKLSNPFMAHLDVRKADISKDVSSIMHDRSVFYINEMPKVIEDVSYICLPVVFLLCKEPLGDPALPLEDMIERYPDIVPVAAAYRTLWSGHQSALDQAFPTIVKIAREYKLF